VRFKIEVDAAKCTGCRMCEMACSFAHEQVYGPYWSRIRVSRLEDTGVDYPVVCQQCLRATCVEACPTGAIYRPEATMAILVDADKCTHCGECVKACPFGAVALHPETGVPMICDLCGGKPVCVSRCETRAIHLAPVKWEDKTRETYPRPVVKEADIGAVNLEALNKRFAFARREAKKVVQGWKAEGIIDV